MSLLAPPMPTQPGRPCSGGCGRELSPGPSRHRRPTRDEDGNRGVAVPGGVCIACLFKSRKVAVPRARRAIRGGLVDVAPADLVNLPALGRGPNRRAKRVATAEARRYRQGRAHARQVVARVRAREADITRSARAEAARRMEKAA